jgi:hypothetical protein
MLGKLLKALFLGGLLASCTSVPEIRTDYDKSIDFAQYKTFAFIQPLGTDREAYSTITTSLIKRAVQTQLEARGYVYSAKDPDLLVNFNTKVEDKTVITDRPVAPIAHYYQYRGRLYSIWNTYGYETDIDQYKEGTLNVDLVDAKRKQLVWEGIAIGRVTQKAIKDRETRINAAVQEIFAQYPFSARQ